VTGRMVTDEKETSRIQLNGIDYPELGQPFGKNATEFVSDTISGVSVCIVPKELDRYGWTIAVCIGGCTDQSAGVEGCSE